MPQDLWADTHEPLEMLDLIREPLPPASDQRRKRHSELLNTYTARCLVGIGADSEADVFRGYVFGYAGAVSSLASQCEQLEVLAGRRSGGSYSMGRRPKRVPVYAQRARATIAAINALHRPGGSGTPWLAAVAVTRETRHLIQHEQCAWLRCLFPNPAGSAPVHLQWLTTTVLQLARGINQESAFDRLPILADALQDAGCDDEGLLHHCRHGSVHGAHCWALTALLANERTSRTSPDQ